MNCPQCNDSTQTVSFQDIEVDRCSSCKGFSFDALELGRLAEPAGSEIFDLPVAAAYLGPDRAATRLAYPH